MLLSLEYCRHTTLSTHVQVSSRRFCTGVQREVATRLKFCRRCSLTQQRRQIPVLVNGSLSLSIHHALSIDRVPV